MAANLNTRWLLAHAPIEAGIASVAALLPLLARFRAYFLMEPIISATATLSHRSNKRALDGPLRMI